MKISELYQSKENRDARAKELKAQGHSVRRKALGVQLIHPQYVKDFTGPERLETGLGNTVYKTRFENLYEVSEV